MFNDFEDIFEESYDMGYSVSDAELNKFGVIECVEDPDVACYRIALENEQNYNALMNAIMMQEMEYLESNGREMVWEAGAIRRIADRIKETIQRWWAKIKGVFKKLMNKLDTFTMSNKAFVRKYRSANVKIKSGLKVTGYPFSDQIVVHYSNSVASIGAFMKSLDSKTTNNGVAEKAELNAFQNRIRGGLINKGNITAENFGRELKEHLYGSVNTTQVPVEKNWTSLLNQLETADIDRKAAKDAYKEAEDMVRELMKLVNDKAKDSNDEDVEKGIKLLNKAVNSALNIMSSALSSQTAAIMARTQQARRIANHVLRSQSKAVGGYSTTESAEYDIEGVELV